MKTINIQDKNRHQTLHSGAFNNPADCIADAIDNGISLAGADLRGLMLVHGNFDGGDFSGAVFDGCDLTGANLSECNLCGASFRGADLSLAALCESRLIGCDFTDAAFAGTLLTAAVVDDCLFTCPSSLGLPFTETASLGTNRYDLHPFTAAPVMVTGLPKRLVFLDDVVLIGADIWPRAEFPNPFDRLFQLTGAKISVSS